MEGLVAESPGTGLQKPIELDFLGARATGDALEFCTRNHLLSDLPKAIETARRFFLIPGRLSVYLERDPEERAICCDRDLGRRRRAREFPKV